MIWACRRRGKSAGGNALAGPWDELFHPSRQMVRHEKERQLTLRDDVESAAPPGSVVDLQAGTAVIRPAQRNSRR
ncbi:DUF6191 domain-containing protein [Streptomyces sp. IBSNAI002]|uniref:DUF6191 domain-containing protein n=1 Tax=Streptomyces sp. IBSNAI002 TaxID=3457500 RepID=UPI003FD2ED85